MLLLLGIGFIVLGLLPLLRWLKCKVSKHHWRVCEIDRITSVVNTRVVALELMQHKFMLVSFRFNGHIHSILVEYNEHLCARYKYGERCTFWVDKSNPLTVYNNTRLWHDFSIVWLFSGVSLCIASFFA